MSNLQSGLMFISDIGFDSIVYYLQLTGGKISTEHYRIKNKQPGFTGSKFINFTDLGKGEFIVHQFVHTQ